VIEPRELLGLLSILFLLVALSTQAAEPQQPSEQEDSEDKLVKQTQNPVADLISVPFQNNYNFAAGPKHNHMIYNLNIQPVIPIHITENWNLIARIIIVHVRDRIESGPKPDLVRALGAAYHAGTVGSVGFEPEITIECTGVAQLVGDSIQAVGAGGIVCLTGVGSGGFAGGRAAGDVAAAAVLKNNVVVGSVNANKRHWYKAGEALARADRSWLAHLITRREKPENFAQALERKPDDIKAIIQFVD